MFFVRVLAGLACNRQFVAVFHLTPAFNGQDVGSGNPVVKDNPPINLEIPSVEREVPRHNRRISRAARQSAQPKNKAD